MQAQSTPTAIIPTTHNLQAAQPASMNPARVYLASLAPGSVRTMRQALATVAAIASGVDVPTGIDDQVALIDATPWGALRFQHTTAIRAALATRFEAGTVNKMLSALRRVLKDAWRLGQMSADEYLAAADVPNVKGEKPDQAAGRAISLGELMALVASCQDGTPRGARDAAMLAVAYSCGLRRDEIVSLDLSSYQAGAAVLTVTGKRNKTRTVPIQNGARAALEDWIAARGDEAGPLFWHVRKGGALVNRRLTTQAVYTVFADHARRAGVKDFSPHDMRRTFAGDLLDAGADIVTVQRMMGHSNVSTTASYDRRGERAKQDAAKRLHFPYTRKSA
jgi:site-specific recombinase XerD